MADIEVNGAADGAYRVTVTADGSTSSHVVTVSPDYLTRLGSGASGDELVVASFRFLLDRESKESIMSRFDLSIVERYFPEYPNTVGDYL